MDADRFRTLGRTGLKVGRLGVACSYGAPTAAFEEAFEQGVNYFYWGSLRKESMARAMHHIIDKGKRDELVIVVQSYSRSAILMEQFFKQALKALQLGPMSDDELKRVQQIGDHVHANYRRFFS